MNIEIFKVFDIEIESRGDRINEVITMLEVVKELENTALFIWVTRLFYNSKHGRLEVECNKKIPESIEGKIFDILEHNMNKSDCIMINGKYKIRIF